MAAIDDTFTHVLSDDEVADLRMHAKKRHKAHRNRPWWRPFNPDYWYTALGGEYVTGLWLGIPMDINLYERGDGGWDFGLEIPGIGKLDTKTAKYPWDLLVEVDHAKADVYILAGIDPKDMRTIKLYGWCYRDELLVRKPKTIKNYKVLNHWVPQSKLRPLSELKELIDGVGVN